MSLISITADHITYIDSTLPDEIDTSRLWFIKRMYPLNDYEWTTARQLSRCWYYQRKLNCSYAEAVERKLSRID